MTDYQKTLHVNARAEVLFDALTNAAGLTAWWTPTTGDGGKGGELKLDFSAPEPCVMRVDEATPAAVRWTVTSCDFQPDWVGTRPEFTIVPAGADAVDLHFRHYGLTEELDCIDMGTQGWNNFLGSLRDYTETGVGRPNGSAADDARRVASR